MQRGDGSSASGKVGYDVLSLGGLTIKEQAIQLAAAPSPQFSHGTMDGIMGLAFRKLNTIHFEGKPFPHATPAENAWRQEDIPVEAGVFTCAVYSTRDPEGDKSFYTFGWIDRYLVQQSGAEIAWTALDEASGLWMFPSERATVGGTPVPRPGNKAIADSGTALVLLSDNVCRELYAQIRGAEYSERDQGYTVPRDITLDELPELSVAIGGTEFAIQKQDLVFAPLDENRWYGGVQSRGENPFDILGDTFLKSVYAVSLCPFLPPSILSLSLSLTHTHTHMCLLCKLTCVMCSELTLWDVQIWDKGNMRFGAVPKMAKTQNVERNALPLVAPALETEVEKIFVKSAYGDISSAFPASP